MTFYEDWEQRYLNGTATLDHLQRLVAIEKLTDEEYKQILLAKRKQQRGMN